MVKGEPLYPKGEKRKTIKARRKRQERKVVMATRPQVALRDGYCRVEATPLGDCRGPSEWAHFGEKKRFKTRGLPPEERHTTAHTLMLCEGHHDDYDEGRMTIEAKDARVCDGDLRFEMDGIVWEEGEPNGE